VWDPNRHVRGHHTFGTVHATLRVLQERVRALRSRLRVRADRAAELDGGTAASIPSVDGSALEPEPEPAPVGIQPSAAVHPPGRTRACLTVP
jgi:hypothetical protein